MKRFTYVWEREGTAIASGGYYTLTREDEGDAVWCVVTAVTEPNHEVLYEVSERSWNSVKFGERKAPPAPPKNESPPKVSGKAAVGETLACSEGTWSGNPPPEFFYQWLRDGEVIPSATSSTYQVAPEDETYALSCVVTAKNEIANEIAEASAESEHTEVVPGSAPGSKTPPEVLGIAEVNQTLTCYEGTWSGSAPLTFAFEWLRDGAPIPLATGGLLPLEPDDEGQLISCKVVALNKLGKAEATSSTVTVGGKLINTRAPVIFGTGNEGETLTCSGGEWNEAAEELKPSYQWLRNETEAILGATAKEYKVASADRDDLLYCQVTAKNGRGEEASALSAPIGVPNGSHVPEIKETGSPEVTGRPEAGDTLTCHEGEWTNSPTHYVFQWLREGAAVAAAKAKTYQVVDADEGHHLSCQVIAENSESPSKAALSATLYVKGEAPSVTPPGPQVFGTPRVGESLSCQRGEWKGAPTPTYAYEWLRDGTTTVGSGPAYEITTGDRGYSLSCTVTASNDEAPDGVHATSNSISVPGEAPRAAAPGPTISGEPTVSSTLSCSEGTWKGAPAPSFTHQWLLNDVPIPSATSSTFTVGSADRGFDLSCKVTATNTEGTASALSGGVHVPGLAPMAEQSPFLTGTAAVGKTLTCERGIWNGAPPPSFTYQWLRDGEPIASQTESTYTVEPADQGHRISCDVTATNDEGSVELETSNGLAIATPSPEASIPPAQPLAPLVPITPTHAVILASLKRQLTVVWREARLATIIKTGRLSFSFLPPALGTLEVLLYEWIPGAHGKRVQLVVARSKTSFANTKRASVRVQLTAKGRASLKGKKRVKLKAKVLYKSSHGPTVSWLDAFTLGH